MSKVAILTDSNSGITQAQAKDMGVTVIPMPFFIDGVEYLEDINLTQEEFYEKLKNDADISTSQPSIGTLQERTMTRLYLYLCQVDLAVHVRQQLW